MTLPVFRPIPGDPFETVLIWHSKDWQPTDEQAFPEPVFAFEHDLLRDQCTSALARRQETYPAWIEAGRITRDEAEADIQGWQLLADEWTWICTGEGTAPAMGLELRRAAVNTALSRIDDELARGNRSTSLFRQLHANRALLWHLHRLTASGEPMAHACAHRTRTFRTQPERKAA